MKIWMLTMDLIHYKYFIHVMKLTVYMSTASNKDVNQPASASSLISVFVIRCLDTGRL